MQYLCIKNHGVCDVANFTVLGVSTARNNAEAIGQFGSGAKHGMLTCLRAGLNPVVYLGRQKLQFHTEPAENYTKVFCKVGTKAPRELSIALEYGELDWGEVYMALREFVSNALDAVEGDPSKVDFKIQERIRPDDDSTIVAIPLNPHVQRFYNGLGNVFLHFNKEVDVSRRLLPKREPGPAFVYRKGVLIRKLPDECGNSLFDYNFGDELRIDESRNLDDYAVSSAAMDAIKYDTDAIKAILRAVIHNSGEWETSFGDNWRMECAAQSKPEVWQKAWEGLLGKDAVVCTATTAVHFGKACINKGYRPVPVADNWLKTLGRAGINSIFDTLDNTNDKGHEILPPTPEVQRVVDTTWEFLEAYGLTKDKDKPPVKMFRDIMEGGGETQGYYKDGTVYIQVGQDHNRQCVLEELAHYITGAGDCCRDFQDYAFRVAAALME